MGVCVCVCVVVVVQFGGDIVNQFGNFIGQVVVVGD